MCSAVVQVFLVRALAGVIVLWSWVRQEHNIIRQFTLMMSLHPMVYLGTNNLKARINPVMD